MGYSCPCLRHSGSPGITDVWFLRFSGPNRVPHRYVADFFISVNTQPPIGACSSYSPYLYIDSLMINTVLRNFPVLSGGVRSRIRCRIETVMTGTGRAVLATS